jgi:hypothetical protein
MSIRKIIDLNNGAVAALQQGRHKQALGFLRSAITDLKKRFVLPAPSTTIQSNAPSSALIVSSAGLDNNGHPSPFKVDQEQNKPSIFSVPLWSEETCTRQQDKTSIFMYSQALILADDDHCKELLIGVVFYNMALVNHARKAVAVIQSRNGDVKASYYWLLMALYSNMAHIYLSRVYSEKLNQCLGNIQSLLAADIVEQVVDAHDYYIFVANSLLQPRIDSAPAA